MVVARKYLKELFSAPESELSFTTPVAESLELRYTFQESIAMNQYHALIVKTELTRNIPALMPDVVDELGTAMEDGIPCTKGVYVPLHAYIEIGHPFVCLRRLRVLWRESATEFLWECHCVCCIEKLSADV